MAAASTVVFVCECSVRALRIRMQTQCDGDDQHDGRDLIGLDCLSKCSVPAWFSDRLAEAGLETVGDMLAAPAGFETIAQRSGVLALGMAKLSHHGLQCYRGSLTAWPKESDLLWRGYGRPRDAVVATAVAAWRFAEPVLLAHREQWDRTAWGPGSPSSEFYRFAS